jgi:hypothetical protein
MVMGMKIHRTIGAALVACAAPMLLSACTVYSPLQHVTLRYDAKADEMRVCIVSYDLGSEERDLESARRDLRSMLAGERRILALVPIPIDELVEEKPDESTTEQQRHMYERLKSTVHVLDARGFFDDRNHPALVQLVSVTQWSTLVSSWNDCISAFILEEERKGELAKSFGEASAKLMRERAAMNPSWITVTTKGMVVEFPLTKDGLERRRHKGDPERKRASKGFDLPLLDLPVWSETVEWADDTCRLSFGWPDGDKLRFVWDFETAYDAKLERVIEEDKLIARDPKLRERALKVIETLEPGS